MIVYKGADDYVIHLELFSDSKTNLERKVLDKNHAKYRTNKAKVIKIVHKFTGQEIDTVKSNYDDNFIYKKGETHIINDYVDGEEACTSGIHFYLTQEPALHYGVIDHDTNYTGRHKTWYDSGHPLSDRTYRNGYAIKSNL